MNWVKVWNAAKAMLKSAAVVVAICLVIAAVNHFG